jgi:hypothetical protein
MVERLKGSSKRVSVLPVVSVCDLLCQSNRTVRRKVLCVASQQSSDRLNINWNKSSDRKDGLLKLDTREGQRDLSCST